MAGRHLPLPLPLLLFPLLVPLAFAPAADATFHEIKVREMYAGNGSNDSYVVLQAYNAGQNFLSGHALTAYGSTGTQIAGFTFPSNVSNGQNQMTVLVADASYASTFSSGPSPDGTEPNLNLDPAGGAVCWAGLDCVTWGDFSGTTPSAAGAPVDPSGIPANTAIRRTIAPNCSTLLEGADDTNVSSTDFFDASPDPRANSSTITEAACPPAPTATIDTKPANPTQSTAASFTYHSTPSGAEFECKLDAVAYAACEASGKEYPGPLADGSHTFQVRAHNVNGTGVPASYTWTVDTQPPTATIKAHPADPSPGGSAAFTYESSEINSTFECSLAAEGQADSFVACALTGKTYTGLANGLYTFKVRATDKAGNQGSAASYGWEVDNSLADTTPPETTITSRPSDPSGSSTASFTYSSNEPGSTFECTLDGAALTSCPVAGITYTGLAEGPHSFQVRAIDPSGNVDPTPAGYSFSVVLAPSVLTPTTTTPVATPRRRRHCRRLKGKARKRCLRRRHRR